MSTHSEAVEHIDGATTKAFVTVWFALLFMTGVEVFLAYEQIPVIIFLTALVGLSVIKAALIIAYFMHLRFEKLSLFLTLFPMLILCIVLMLVMFMPDSRVRHEHYKHQDDAENQHGEQCQEQAQLLKPQMHEISDNQRRLDHRQAHQGRQKDDHGNLLVGQEDLDTGHE